MGKKTDIRCNTDLDAERKLQIFNFLELFESSLSRGLDLRSTIPTRRKKLTPKVVTTLFAIVVSRETCACFSVCFTLDDAVEDGAYLARNTYSLWSLRHPNYSDRDIRETRSQTACLAP